MSEINKAPRYMIRREGQVYGPFTEAEIKEMIDSSIFSVDDEISYQELSNWQKIKATNLWYEYRN